MHRLAHVVLAPAVLLVAACAKSEPAKDTTAAMAPAAAAPAPAPTLARADVAGKWQFASVPMAGKDTSPTKWTLSATGDTTGWTMTFPDKQVVPLQVSVAGDSIMISSGE